MCYVEVTETVSFEFFISMNALSFHGLHTFSVYYLLFFWIFLLLQLF